VDGSNAQRGVYALTRIGQAMASTADYEQALATLISTISDVLDVESAGFMLFDPEHSRLVLQQPAFGIDDPERVSAYRVNLAEGGNAVRVFLTKQPYISNAPHSDPRVIRRYVDLFDVRNVLTVPLVVEDAAIGVCHALNRRGGGFTAEDLELATLIAPLLAVSVQSANMFRRVREQRRQLERAVFLQRELTRTAFDAAGMHDLAERLADLLARPVMVLDPALRSLASVEWPADLPPDESWLRERRGDPARRAAVDGVRCPLLTPIAVGPHFGGYLGVLDDGGIDEIDSHAVEHAATIFALEMLRERTSYEVETRLRGELLRDLFAGDARDEALHRRLSELGSTVTGPWRVVQLHVRWRDTTSTRSARWRDEVHDPAARLYRQVQHHCRELFGSAPVAPWRSGLLLVLPADAVDSQRDIQVAAELLDRTRSAVEQIRPGSRINLAMSSAVRAATGLAAGAEQADQALQVARTLRVTDRPLVFEHLGVFRVLLGGADARQRAQFVDEALGTLERYDVEHGTDLVATLRGYVAADYNAAEAARQLYVHTNTLNYRLRTIRRLLGGNPARGDLRLQVELALKMQDIARLALAHPTTASPTVGVD
jgi:purine catabolism regulator